MEDILFVLLSPLAIPIFMVFHYALFHLVVRGK
jgi:hypothetical protein